jgi:hypothetical protein
MIIDIYQIYGYHRYNNPVDIQLADFMDWSGIWRLPGGGSCKKQNNYENSHDA